MAKDVTFSVCLRKTINKGKLLKNKRKEEKYTDTRITYFKYIGIYIFKISYDIVYYSEGFLKKK